MFSIVYGMLNLLKKVRCIYSFRVDILGLMVVYRDKIIVNDDNLYILCVNYC